MVDQTVLNQSIERDIRHMIGDLHVQVLVLRQILEQTQQELAQVRQQSAPEFTAASQSPPERPASRKNGGAPIREPDPPM